MEQEVTNQAATTKDSISLYIAIAAMACVAATFVFITFTLFLRSSAYVTVKEIQANARLNGSSLGDYDTTSPVKSADIDETIKGIQNKIDSLDNSADYGAAAVSDDSLGLVR